MTRPWWHPEPKFLIASAIIGLFIVAYLRDPNETLQGALIAAFAAAWGYYLGSSKGASENRDVLNDLARKGEGPKP